MPSQIGIRNLIRAAIVVLLGGTAAQAQTPGITVTSPNGGEWWMVGENRAITWTSTGTIANVKIESSTNGAAWATVIASTPNDGSHPWTVPNTPSAQCLVRVSDASTPAVSDASNAVFAIVSDPTEPNDTSATATVLPIGTTPNLRYVGSSDVDWYKMFVPPELAGQVLKVNLRVTSAYPDPPPANWRSDLDFDMFDGALRFLGTAFSGSDNETLYLSNVASGWYYIMLGYSTSAYADGLGVARYSVTVEPGSFPAVGAVAGRVVDGSGQGVGGVYVRLQSFPYNHEVSFPVMTTAPDGTFWLAHGPGSHDLWFAGDDGNTAHPRVNVVKEYYRDKKTLALADHVTMTAGQTLDVGDILVDVGAIVSGRVTNTSGVAQNFASVIAYDLEGNQSTTIFTDVNGNYSVNAVPTGGAKLRFNKSPYAAEYYNDKPSLGTANVLPTVAGQTLTGIDAQLGTGGTISGTVRNGAGTGLAVTVRLFSMSDGAFARASTMSSASTGSYTLGAVLPGQYALQFDAAGTGYATEWYSDASSFAQATPVTATAGVTTSGIDATLTSAAPTLTAVLPTGGRVTGGSPILITGTGFQVGATVTVGGAQATGVQVVGATTIAALTPPGLAGAATVSVTTSNGTGSLPNGFTYLPLPVFTDEPLSPGATPVKALHIVELRQRVNELRGRYGLTPSSWTDPTLTPGQSTVKAAHVTELRTALNAMLSAAGLPLPSYTRPTLVPGETVVAAVDITELRAALNAAW